MELRLRNNKLAGCETFLKEIERERSFCAFACQRKTKEKRGDGRGDISEDVQITESADSGRKGYDGRVLHC